MPNSCTRGAVLEVNLDPSVGREIMKSRPCLVVQSDLINRHSKLTIIAPITGAENKREGPTIVPIRQGEGGLTKDSVVLCHQVRVVDESRLGRLYGHVRPETMRRVQNALKVIFDIQC